MRPYPSCVSSGLPFLMILVPALSAVGVTKGFAGAFADALPTTSVAVRFSVAPAVRDVPPSTDVPVSTVRPPRMNPLAGEPDGGQRGTWNRRSIPVDPLIGRSAGPGATPPLDFSFEGIGNPEGCGLCTSPDPNGAAGPNHYVQMVNATKVGVFDRAGTRLLVFTLHDLWNVGELCHNNAGGDPVVIYDGLADRWVISQLALPRYVCFAVSLTPDPAGAYALYTFNVGDFPDYFKFGAWPNAYYMGASENSGYSAYAFDRVMMLAGDPSARFVKFAGETNFLLPASLDGPTLPPATSSPGFFYTFKSSTFHGGTDRIELFTLNPDFTNPLQSTFTLTATLPIAPFTYTVCGFMNFDCANQPGQSGTPRLDVLSEWPMFRFPYRNLGEHEALVGNFTVGGRARRGGCGHPLVRAPQEWQWLDAFPGGNVRPRRWTGPIHGKHLHERGW